VVDVADPFTRSDEELDVSANWENDSGTFEVQSNEVEMESPASGIYRKARWVGTALSADYTCDLEADEVSGTVAIGPGARLTADSNVSGYAVLGWSADTYYLVDLTAGSENVLGSGDTPTAGDILTVSVDGTTIAGLIDDSQFASTTDSSYSSGQPGIFAYGAGVDGDNWAASDIESGELIEPPEASAASSAIAPTVVKGSDTVAPAEATVTSSAIAPTVELGSITITPAIAEVASSAIAPTIVYAALIEPPEAAVTSSAIAPTVVKGSDSITPAIAEVVSSAIAPTVQLGDASIEPAIAEAASSAIAPTVVIGGGGEEVEPPEASAISSAIAPTILYGSVSISPPLASVESSAIAPTVQAGGVTDPQDLIRVRGRWQPT
jgi:hypothetical protein